MTCDQLYYYEKKQDELLGRVFKSYWIIAQLHSYITFALYFFHIIYYIDACLFIENLSPHDL